MRFAAEQPSVLRPPNVYVLDRKEQEDKLARLAEAEVKDDGWTRYFADPETDERWTLYHPRSEEHGGGPRFLRRGDIPNDVAGWAVALLRNGTEADVVGAGTDLSAEPEMWSALLDRIEAERDALHRPCPGVPQAPWRASPGEPPSHRRQAGGGSRSRRGALPGVVAPGGCSPGP